ncbi:MAG: hypothetical protein HKN82_03275, partial [Akkermansiaceae bacterium]|nr:hypothetical protein [Akkermansiaceae bacterium]
MKLAILLLFPCLAFAQQAPKHSCRLLFLDGPDAAPDTLHLFDGVESQEVELPRLNLSQVYKLRPGALTLHLLAGPPGDPEKIPAGAPSVAVPATVTDFY